MNAATQTGPTPITPEIAQAITAVLERQILVKVASIMDDRSQVLEDVEDVARMARVLMHSVGFEGYPPLLTTGGIRPLDAEGLAVVIRAARWEDTSGEDCLLNQWDGSEPGYRPEYVESFRRRAETGRAVLAYLGAERGNPYLMDCADAGSGGRR